MSTYKGQCLCGLIKYEVDKIESQMGHCHCSMCRKFHGAAFATFGEARTENFHWTGGEKYLKSFQADNGTIRQFCDNCGTSMIFKPANDTGKLVEFALGTLDSDIDLRPDAHIFVESKACWVEITDNLPQHASSRTS